MTTVPRLVVASSLVALACVVFAASSVADNRPIALEPGAGQHVAQPPSSVTVALLKPAKKPVVVNVVGPGGTEVTEGPTEMLSTNLSVPIKSGIVRGTYTVTYRVESDRGPEGGSYQFAYGQGTTVSKTIKTWNGYRAMPKSVMVDGDVARAQATASATPIPTSASASASATTAAPTETVTEDQSASAKKTGGPNWVWPTVGAFVVLGAGLAILARRRYGGDKTDL